MNRMKIVLVTLMSLLMGMLLKVEAMVIPENVFHDPQLILLARATARGDVNEVERLLAKGARVKSVGKQGFTVTHFALYAKSHAPEVLRLLLRAGADPISRLANGHDVPHDAAARDDADPAVLGVLLDAGVSPDFIGGATHGSLLDSAVSGRNLSVVALLLNRGANVNFNHPFTGTALHTALTIPDFQIATLLLDHGADPNLRNKQSPAIAPEVIRRTPAEAFCHFHGGKRKHPTPEQRRDFDAMVAAFARRGIRFPCKL